MKETLALQTQRPEFNPQNPSKKKPGLMSHGCHPSTGVATLAYLARSIQGDTLSQNEVMADT